MLDALELLKIPLDDSKKEHIKSTLQLSNTRFIKAMEYALDSQNITDSKIAQSFHTYNAFLQSQKTYCNTPIKHIGICGNMNAGKSSFINALLGQDLLLAKSTARTACVTSVYDNDLAKNAYGVCIKNNQIADISDDVESGILNSWNVFQSHIILQANIDNISNKHCILALHDTPAVNNSADERHRTSTMDFFTHNAMDIIIYVANVRHLCTTDEKAFLESLQQNILANNKAKILFILNQCDCIEPQKESLEKIIKNYQNFLENTDFESPNIYPLSSKAARLFKMVLHNRTQALSTKEKYDFLRLLHTFCEHIALDSTPLESYQLSQDSNETIAFQSSTIEKSTLFLALKNTGILKLENHIQKLLQEHTS